MISYPARVCAKMKLFYESLSEKDRRRYAAVEAEKLDHGGVEYIASVLGCDPKTIWQGQRDVAELPSDEAAGRVRKKGGSQTS
ncbi:MAG: hypothetical protein SFX18_09035 [Pirellulales bacterium]|nr:hypothetical protein [Pirellulales bacterium]